MMVASGELAADPDGQGAVESGLVQKSVKLDKIKGKLNEILFGNNSFVSSIKFIFF
jgi:hypothetical protein